MRLGSKLGYVSALGAVLTALPHLLEAGSWVDPDLARIARDRLELLEGNERLRVEIAGLDREVRALRAALEGERVEADPALERVAREDLNLAYPDEVVFELEVATAGGSDR